ncbi:unnamed protein product [Scytosiphon promiscuus]
MCVSWADEQTFSTTLAPLAREQKRGTIDLIRLRSRNDFYLHLKHFVFAGSPHFALTARTSFGVCCWTRLFLPRAAHANDYATRSLLCQQRSTRQPYYCRPTAVF